MSVIRWEEPPAAHAATTGKPKHLISHELIAFQLRNRPGQWALVHESSAPAAIAGVIREGRVRAYRPARSFEAVQRTVDDLNCTYARYVGEGES